MSDWTALGPRVFTSGNSLPERDFSGYGFDGLDFVVGNKGLSEYEIKRQRRFSGRDDGCCFLLEQRDSDHIISTDPVGLCKLFVYQSKQGWAVSNSFTALMDQINEEGWAVTPDYAVLDAWTLPPNAFGASFSTGTVVREITLLNPAQYIVIKSGVLHIEQHQTSQKPTEQLDYEAKISEFLQIWLGRILGLAISNKVSLGAELTGGLDSRTVFAFLLHLRKRGALPSLDKVAIFCSKPSSTDHVIAQSLADVFDFNLTNQSSSDEMS